MTTPVSWQEINLATAQRSADERVGERPKRRIDLMFGDVLDFLHLIQPAAADDANCRNVFTHCALRFNPKDRLDEKRIISPWRTRLRRVLFSPVHAEIFHQDLRLPDERARLGTGRALAHGTRLRTCRTRDRSRRRAPEHVQRARHGRPEGAGENGNARSHGKRAAARGVRFYRLYGPGAWRVPAEEFAACRPCRWYTEISPGRGLRGRFGREKHVATGGRALPTSCDGRFAVFDRRHR